MEFKLTMEETEIRAEISANLEKAWTAVENAVSEYNAKVNAAKAEVAAVVASFNDVTGQAAVFIQGVADRASLEIDDKTEKWQEGDVGQAAIAWKDEWEGFDCDGIEDINWPDELVIEQPSVVDMDTALPDEAE